MWVWALGVPRWSYWIESPERTSVLNLWLIEVGPHQCKRAFRCRRHQADRRAKFAGIQPRVFQLRDDDQIVICIDANAHVVEIVRKLHQLLQRITRQFTAPF